MVTPICTIELEWPMGYGALMALITSVLHRQINTDKAVLAFTLRFIRGLASQKILSPSEIRLYVCGYRSLRQATPSSQTPSVHR
jgi:hypothetical protein